MKQKINHILLCLLVSISLLSCKEEAFTPIDVSTLNPDNPALNTELDQWIKTNFVDEYNADVIYRYSRYFHESDRNVAPPRPETVKPMMQTVLSGFVNPYRKIAGKTFIKETMPKQWVLYGSTSYDASNIGYAGTASGGVRVNLFGLNGFSNSASFVTGRLSVIHHEFTHILNQLVPIPADFKTITAPYYKATWTSTPVDSARKWGFVSSYASQNEAEDYAETNTALLVKGQPWFDNWVKTTGSATGSTALRLKEQNVVNYFTGSLNIDYRALQKEVQLYIKDTLKDPAVTFPYWLNQGLYKTMTIDLNDGSFNTYPLSAAYLSAHNNFKDSVLARNTTAKYRLDYIQFRFDSPTSLVVRAAFTATAGTATGTQYFGDYSFSMAINTNAREVTFTKIAQATGTTFSNGNIFLSAFSNTLQPFLTSGAFIGEWLPLQAPPALYTKTGGFTQKNNPANHFWGFLGQ